MLLTETSLIQAYYLPRINQDEIVASATPTRAPETPTAARSRSKDGSAATASADGSHGSGVIHRGRGGRRPLWTGVMPSDEIDGEVDTHAGDNAGADSWKRSAWLSMSSSRDASAATPFSTLSIIPVVLLSKPSTKRRLFHGSTTAMAPTKTTTLITSATTFAHVDTLRILSLQTCSS